MNREQIIADLWRAVELYRLMQEREAVQQAPTEIVRLTYWNEWAYAQPWQSGGHGGRL